MSDHDDRADAYFAAGPKYQDAPDGCASRIYASAADLRREIVQLQQLVSTLTRDCEIQGACVDRLRAELGESEGARAVQAQRIRELEAVLMLAQRGMAQG